MRNFENIFSDNKNEIDFNEPNMGHLDRFQAKLKNQEKLYTKPVKKQWHWLAIAASFLLFFGYWLGNNNKSNSFELADVSPKMEETQNFYLATIYKEVEQVKAKQTPENKVIIDDAFQQLQILEKEYKMLTLELSESSKDKRIIYAMITNFQNRLEVLQNLVDRLEDFQEYEKQSSNQNIV